MFGDVCLYTLLISQNSIDNYMVDVPLIRGFLEY